jgi:hypothetical protein
MVRVLDGGARTAALSRRWECTVGPIPRAAKHFPLLRRCSFLHNIRQASRMARFEYSTIKSPDQENNHNN